MGSLQVYEKVADPLQFAEQMGEAAALMCGMNDKVKGKAIALHAMIEGLSLVDMGRKYHVIEGKLTMRADAMLAEFRMNHGGNYKKIERTPERAAIEFVDKYNNKYTEELKIEDIKQSRWPWKSGKGPGAASEKDREWHSRNLKNNWSTPVDQANMLWARLISSSLGWICPELKAGVYTPEEAQDFDSSPLPEAGESTVIEATIVQPDEEPPREALNPNYEPPKEEPEPKASSPDPEIEAAMEEAETPKADGKSNLHSEILLLCQEIGVNDEQLAGALKRRGKEFVSELNEEEATEFRDKLLEKKRSREAASQA